MGSPWNYEQLMLHLDRLQEAKITLGLERMTSACERMRHPERVVPCVHVAGTNGKGSTIAFLSALLQDAGYRVGAYTSPHMHDYAERITLDEMPGSHAALAQRAETVAQQCHDIPLSYFEFTTLLAFAYYANQRPDIVLYETGLGGRLDATNVVQPLVSVITSIAHDHHDWLGSTLTDIAKEKCGIIKPHVPVVSAPQVPEVMSVVQSYMQSRCAAPATVNRSLGMAGEHQRINAGVALAVMDELERQGWRKGRPEALANAQWTGRCEWVSENPPILFDGAHNVAAAKALATYIHRIRDGRRVECYLGVLREKDRAGIVDALTPVVDALTAVSLPGPRGTAEGLALDELPSRLALAQRNTVTVVTGSLLLYPYVVIPAKAGIQY